MRDPADMTPSRTKTIFRFYGRDGVTGRVLAVSLGIAASLWAFLTVAGEMVEGETRLLDERILLALRAPGDLNDPIGPRWLEEAMRDVTALGGFTVLTLLTIVTVVTLFRARRRWHAMVMAVAVIGAELSSDVMKLVYARPRPALVPHGSYVYSNSFPSGHSTVSAAAFLTLALLVAATLKRRASKVSVYAAAILVLVGVGVSRIYLGVHWPSDVLAGWSLGTGWAIIGWLLLGLQRPAPPG